MRLAGIDLAWKSEINTTAVAIGDLKGKSLSIDRIEPALRGIEKLKDLIREEAGLVGVAVDAPLIINNESGQRECETSLSSYYSRRKVSCHSSNLSRYPDATSVNLSVYLKEGGFEHIRSVYEGRFQIECYPHPAIIEIFGLPERLKYKKGGVSCRKQGQIKLSKYILALGQSRIVSLSVNKKILTYLSEKHIESLTGTALKSNEDALDSIVCLYVCALFATSVQHHIYGNLASGYIYVPTQKC